MSGVFPSEHSASRVKTALEGGISVCLSKPCFFWCLATSKSSFEEASAEALNKYLGCLFLSCIQFFFAQLTSLIPGNESVCGEG